MLSDTYIHVSLPNWGLIPDSKDSLVNSYIICRDDSQSGTLNETCFNRKINAITMNNLFLFLYLQMEELKMN
jgi:hypothetical protein